MPEMRGNIGQYGSQKPREERVSRSRDGQLSNDAETSSEERDMPMGCVNMYLTELSSWNVGAGNPMREFKRKEQMREWSSLRNYTTWGILQDNQPISLTSAWHRENIYICSRLNSI